ncbi:MAG: hypothetical protein DI602_09790 [Aliarcobacter butzleri]|nr:MAG: hypothetical protein DI602_09790 [Aliarcobacter butzleri]
MSEKFSASAQYNDIKGNIAIDNGDSKGLFDLLEDNNINTNTYFPIGIKYYKAGTLEIFKVFTIKKQNNYDTVKEYIDSQETVPVKTFDIEISLEDYINKYTKRFSIAVSNLDEFIGKEFIEI